MTSFLSEGKIEHCRKVAELMYNIAKFCCDYDEEICKEMYALGMVHDIGYLGITEPADHLIEGAAMLPGYKYAGEILYHGLPHKSDFSEYIRLLNFADLHVNSKGEIVPIISRVADISKRYGEHSREYKYSMELSKKHYDDAWFLYMEAMYFS